MVVSGNGSIGFYYDVACEIFANSVEKIIFVGEKQFNKNYLWLNTPSKSGISPRDLGRSLRRLCPLLQPSPICFGYLKLPQEHLL